MTRLDGAALGEALRAQFGIALSEAELDGVAAALAETRPGHRAMPD